MSYYYTYYIGTKTEDDKIYPLGPYTAKGKLKPALERSRSFASDLHERFFPVVEEQITEELRKEFEYENWNGERSVDVKYLPVKNLPGGSFVKSGYFLIEDVEAYQKDDDTFDLFYDRMTPEVYAARSANELRFGPPKPKTGCEGEEYTEHSCADYMYFAYPDYFCEEYEAHILRAAADSLESYGDEGELVVLLTQG